MIAHIPGSEKFESRTPILAHSDIEWPASLRPHTVTEEQQRGVDPLSYEVIRHRLAAIATEMAEGLRRMSGSLIVTDVNDFNVLILDELGEVVQFGLYNLHLSAAGSLAVQWILRNRAINPGIRDGDMFISTDPWVGGGLHQNDVCLVAPVFISGKLFAWAVAIAHQVDVGGVAPGSWSTKGEDVFWESLPLPPIRIVERGQLREDIADSYVRRSRTPQLIALDLRAKIGANNIGIERLHALTRRYGADTVKSVMRRIITDSERRLRERLRGLPDGSWSAVAYQDSAREGDRNIYRVLCTLSKHDDQLTFDFRGTDAQAEGFINCTYAGLRAGVIAALLPTLCGDIPWSGGLWRAIEIISEPGTVNDASFPAGVGKASVASSFATQSVAIEVISSMLDAAGEPHLRETLSAVPCGAWDLAIISGNDQHHRPFVAMIGDAMAAGSGATGTRDGGDTSGIIDTVKGRIADVEMAEFQYPILYLWRREEIDSGGPGRFRGGLGGSSCFVLHGNPDGRVDLVVSQSGKTVPQPTGISGGRTGNTGMDIVIRDSNILELFAAGSIPAQLAQLNGKRVDLPPHLATHLAAGDVYYMQWQGGGGYGDPRLRDPHAVAADVHAHKISSAAAEQVYGVVLREDGSPDLAATSSRRSRTTDQPHQSQAITGTRFDENLILAASGELLCTHCAYHVGDPDNYLERATLLVLPPTAAGPQIHAELSASIDVAVEFRDYQCPGCGTSLHNEVVPVTDRTYRTKKLSLR